VDFNHVGAGLGAWLAFLSLATDHLHVVHIWPCIWASLSHQRTLHWVDTNKTTLHAYSEFSLFPGVTVTMPTRDLAAGYGDQVYGGDEEGQSAFVSINQHIVNRLWIFHHVEWGPN
jgi:hypothetical protein